MNKITCPVCEIEFIKDLPDDAYYEEHCYDCSYWISKTNLRPEDEARRVIVAGVHYMVGEPGTIKGHGGALFQIAFHDGRRVNTDNLWCNGFIASEFRDLLSDNAVFIEDVTAAGDVKYQADDIPF